jgi:hypothetical protein
LVLGGCAGDPSGAPTAPITVSPAASSVSETPSLEPPGHDDDGADLIYTPGKPVDPAPAAALRARRFAERWARPDLPPDRWWSDLAPLSAEQLAELLRDTDPANVSATRVTGAPKATTSVPDDAVFEVPTDQGMLVLGLHKTAGKWRVVRIIDFRPSGR